MGINCNKKQLTTNNNNTLTQGVGLGVPTVIMGFLLKNTNFSK